MGDAGAADMPPATFDVGPGLVRALLRDQFPEIAAAPVVKVAEGWDNFIFRVGPALTARLPRRPEGAELVEHEQRWLPRIAPLLALPTPVPIQVGMPGRGYPWRWSICRWLPGEPAAVAAPSDLGEAADTLASFLTALHVPAPPAAPRNALRGVPIAARHEAWLAALDVSGLPDASAARLRAIWSEGLAAEPHLGAPLWIHGDLHPANLLVDAGRLSGVLDFGDMAAGDPATDLAVAWMLLDGKARARLRRRTSYDDATWARAAAWAAGIGVVMLANSANEPVIHRIGERTVAAVAR
ncbi:MAG TPA: aminoglycoside phosphotransferase family protein [Acidimicrobiales bacterium]|nr:aminoglycoside phosphotransferase family protein [Acidimicrobiales bacterium]